MKANKESNIGHCTYGLLFHSIRLDFLNVLKKTREVFMLNIVISNYTR